MATTCLGRSWSWMGTPLPQLLREPLGSYQRREIKPRSCQLRMPRGWQVRAQADCCAFPSPPEPSGQMPQHLGSGHREHEPLGDLDPGRRLPEAVFLGLRSGKQQGWPGSRSVKAGAASAVRPPPNTHSLTRRALLPRDGGGLWCSAKPHSQQRIKVSILNGANTNGCLSLGRGGAS